MNSFTSSFRVSTWWCAGLFLVPVIALLVPYEITIRAVEARYGREAVFGYAGTDQRKLEWFLETVRRRGGGHDTLIVGNSQCEYGLNPSVLKEQMPELGDIYDLSFSGSSFLAGLEIVERLRLRPKTAIVCVSAADFSRPMVDRGSKIAQAVPDELDRATAEPALQSWRARLDGALAQGFSQILRSADPRYHRSLADFARLIRTPAIVAESLEEAGRFLTTGHTGKELLGGGRYYIAYTDSGFMGLVMRRAWELEEFRRLGLEPSERYYKQETFPSYRADSGAYFAAARDRLSRLRQGGTRIVLVRMPVYRAFQELEDRETGFDAQIAGFARDLGLPLIVPEQIAGDLTGDVRNFRDAAHLHEQSSFIVSTRLAAAIRRTFSGSSL